MSRIIHKVLIVAFFMLLALGVGSCVEPIDPSLRLDAPRLTFWIYVPGSMQQPATKALQGDVSSVSPESQLHDIQVWAFRHGASDDDQILSYVDVSGINWSHSGTKPRSWNDCYELSMSIPQDFLLEADPRIDFYILANWRSVFTNKPGQTKLKDVRDMIYSTGSVNFGVTKLTQSVPQAGLPISTIYKGEDEDGVSLLFLKNAIANGTSLTQNLFHENLEVIELKRTVSKLRFVFSRPDGLDGVSITRVVLNEGLIPDQNWVFEKSSPIVPTGTAYGAAATLGSTATPLLTSSAIGSCEDPKTLTCDWFESNTPQGYAQTAQGYDNYLRDAINFTTENNVRKPKATEKVIYFRESDKSLIGKIYYKLSDSSDSPEYSADFTMGTLDNKYNNFRRNHYWTVYAYFQGDGLYIKPVVLPWADATPSSYTWSGEAHVAISDKTQGLFAYGWTTANNNTWYIPGTNQKTEWFFRRQDKDNPTDDDWNNDWVNSQMVIAPGLNAAGVPIYSNRIQLLSSFASREGFTGLTLKSNNPAFGFVVYNSTIILEGTEQKVSGLSSILDEVVIPIGDRTTYFYVTPKAAYNYTVPNTSTVPALPDNCKVAVSLVTNEESPVKVPFNTSVFPGSQDNGDIYFYCVTEAEFKTYYSSTRPESIKPYGKDSNGKINPVDIDH